MEKVYKFECGNCKHIWNSTEYSILENADKFTNYIDGYNCPKCESRDVSGDETK